MSCSTLIAEPLISLSLDLVWQTSLPNSSYAAVRKPTVFCCFVPVYLNSHSLKTNLPFCLCFICCYNFPLLSRLALQQAGRNPSLATLDKYWTSRRSTLNFDDFCEILQHEKKTDEPELMRAFKKFDVNGDGYITHSELERALTTVSHVKH